MGGFWLAFGVVALAEMGDKSQLACLALAVRHRPLDVVAAVFGASVLIHGLAVTVGAAVAAAVPERTLGLVAGGLFVVFGVLEAVGIVRGESDDDDEAAAGVDAAGRARWLVVAGVAAALALSEMGDKTQLATAGLAGRNGPWGTWAGAVAGMTVADGAAVAVAVGLRRRLPLRTLRWLAVAAFLVTGTVLLLTA